MFGGTSGFDVNSAAPAVLATIGLPPDLVAEIVRRRQIAPLRQPDLGRLAQIGRPGAAGCASAATPSLPSAPPPACGFPTASFRT